MIEDQAAPAAENETETTAPAPEPEPKAEPEHKGEPVPEAEEAQDPNPPPQVAKVSLTTFCARATRQHGAVALAQFASIERLQGALWDFPKAYEARLAASLNAKA